ncbi:amidohydrolase family protein [Microbacterium sp. SORGH_AS_0862]|uniref:amidohydrolase family protein n=1 Tax=Microbacterium sp. SORGH_AS_0862 TaxID=3041789 RepID=UPI002794F6E7|nr:amidohydrolase family protein [Microbacterium sp. SORGH_AS_0862]MDQ1204705.1 putative TIM-barrel fold metal-dependent hydrolase [Microbacterium sp. SORGH_AS_0862]
MTIDLNAVTAIDVHVHVQIDDSGRTASPPALTAAMAAYFGSSEPPRTVDATAHYYRERNMAAVVFTVDATTNLGHAPNSIDDLAAGAHRNADVLIPFGSVDPLQGEAAVEEARRQVGELGVRGFKFHPSVQGFDPSAQEFDALWSTIEELGVPIIVHTGQTGAGAGTPGGWGFRLSLSNPMLLDDVAARHPDLQVIMAHPSVPWQDEALSIATHKLNTWIDLSGWSPKYFSPALVRAARTYLKHKMLFGSDMPALTPDRWLNDVQTLEFPPDVHEMIVKQNAARLLGLS